VVAPCAIPAGTAAIPTYPAAVKKFVALVFAGISGFYLVFLGWIPDPLPIIDEATALIVFVKSMAVLGIDLTRFVPFLGKKSKGMPKTGGPVVDV
jgi:hypothetical protein